MVFCGSWPILHPVLRVELFNSQKTTLLFHFAKFFLLSSWCLLQCVVGHRTAIDLQLQEHPPYLPSATEPSPIPTLSMSQPMPIPYL